MGWYLNERYPVAERLAEFGFYLPSGLGMSIDDAITAAKILRDLLEAS